MPALTARDLEARLTGQAEKSGGYVISPRSFDPYEPGGVKSETEEVACALVNGSSPGFHSAVCFENHQTDARTTEVDVAPTMGATHNAQAANNNPLVVAPAGGVVAIDMDKNKPTNADKPVRKGGAGFGVSEKGASYTLTARDQHAVAYAIDSMGSNAMKSKNPKSGCRKIECAPTLTTVDSAPVKHQGGMAVVGVFDMEAGKSGGRGEAVDVSPTILALHGTDPHAVCIGFNCEAGTHVQTPKEELGETLAARHKCGVAIGGAVSFEPGLARRERGVFRAGTREARGRGAPLNRGGVLDAPRRHGRQPPGGRDGGLHRPPADAARMRTAPGAARRLHEDPVQGKARRRVPRHAEVQGPRQRMGGELRPLGVPANPGLRQNSRTGERRWKWLK